MESSSLPEELLRVNTYAACQGSFGPTYCETAPKLVEDPAVSRFRQALVGFNLDNEIFHSSLLDKGDRAGGYDKQYQESVQINYSRTVVPVMHEGTGG